MTYCVPSDINEIVERLGGDGRVFRGSRIVVSGSAGFLGRHIVLALKGLGAAKIVALDNMATASSLGEEFVKSLVDDPVVRCVRCDVSKLRLPDEALEPSDYIIHAAGLTSPFWYRKYPFETLDVSIAGTRNMLKLARDGARILFTSTSEVYGDPPNDQVPTPETFRGNVSTLGPRSVYDEAKRVGETLCYAYHVKYDVPVVIVRIFNAYGPGLSEQDYRVMPNFAAQLKAGKPLKVYQPGRQTRTFTYVTDTITGCLLALAKGQPGGAFNIGAPSPEVTVLELTERMGEIMQRKPKIEIVAHPTDYPSDEPQRRCPDIAKAREQLDFNPVVSLAEGLQRFLIWAEENYRGDA